MRNLEFEVQGSSEGNIYLVEMYTVSQNFDLPIFRVGTCMMYTHFIVRMRSSSRSNRQVHYFYAYRFNKGCS